MSDFGWAVLENIVILLLAALCFFFLPNWWRLCGFGLLIFMNLFGRRKV